eukprot:scaffold136813_cov148-Phaeocystis_antarctica.AAC.1
MRVLQRVHSLCPRVQVDLTAKWPRRPALAVDDRGLQVHVRAAIAGKVRPTAPGRPAGDGEHHRAPEVQVHSRAASEVEPVAASPRAFRPPCVCKEVNRTARVPCTARVAYYNSILNTTPPHRQVRTRLRRTERTERTNLPVCTPSTLELLGKPR